MYDHSGGISVSSNFDVPNIIGYFFFQRRVRFVEPIKTPSSERRLLRRFAAMRPLATPPKSNGFLPISYSLKRLRRSVSFDRGELHRPKDKFLDCSPIANELTPKEASPAGLRTLLKSPIVPSGLDLLLNSPILSDSESNLDSSQESLDISDCSQDCWKVLPLYCFI